MVISTLSSWIPGYDGGIIRRDRAFWRLIEKQQELPWPDLIVSHDCFSLFAATELSSAHACPILYDIVDYPIMSGRTGNAYNRMNKLAVNKLWSFHSRLAKRSTAILSVSRPMADHCGSLLQRNVEVFSNARSPICVEGNGSVRAGDELRVVLHGRQFPEDGFGEACDFLMMLPSSAELHVVGEPFPGLEKQFLQARIEGIPSCLKSRIKFLGHVPPEQLLNTLTKYDLGLVFWSGHTENTRLGLPNRFWDLMAAGVATVHSGIEAINAIALQNRELPIFDLTSILNDERSRFFHYINEQTSGERLAWCTKLREFSARSVTGGDESFQNVVMQLGAPKNTIILSRTPLSMNRRVQRQIALLSELGADSTVLELGDGTGIPSLSISKYKKSTSSIE